MGASFPNIDKNSFQHGEYVGYTGQHAWRIAKMNPNKSKHKWLAQTVDGQYFYRPTLAGVSKELLRRDVVIWRQDRSAGNAPTVTNC